MRTVATHLCKCGIRLTVVSEPKEQTILLCPEPNCQGSHVVNGEILEVFVVNDNGDSVPHDWKSVNSQSRLL